MKTAGAIRVPVKKHVPVVPLVVAMGVLSVAIGAGTLWHGLASEDGGASEQVRIERSVAATQGQEIASRAGVAQILRHRPISLVGVIRAVGLENVAVGEDLGSPALMKALRLRDVVSPTQLKRLEARRS